MGGTTSCARPGGRDAPYCQRSPADIELRLALHGFMCYKTGLAMMRANMLFLWQVYLNTFKSTNKSR